MKFGKNLSAQQTKCGWLHYLNYKDLKKVIKLDPADASFDAQLQAEIEAVNSAFSEQVAVIQAQLERVADSAGPVSTRLRELILVAEQVEVLRRFAVWNAVGVVKILKKRTKALAGPTPPGLSPSQPGPSVPQGTASSGGPTCSSPSSGMGSTPESWLSRQLFFSGSDFAELQAQLESLAGSLAKDRLSELPACMQLSTRTSLASVGSVQAVTERCPICLEECVDAVELSSCGHRFCWKCVVLGPIAFAPGEYRLSRCSVCRNEQPLDPTRNFKTVCSNQLALLSQIAEHTQLDQEGFGAGDGEWSSGLEMLYGTASGGGKSELESAKERQAMESIDAPAGGMTAFFCSLCCEPLLLEAVSTTPCKHHFHRFCLEKVAEPLCPLCGEHLPVHLVTPRYVQHHLLRGGGTEMVSYMHCARPSLPSPVPSLIPTEKEYMTMFGPVKPFSAAVIAAKREKAKTFTLSPSPL